jgi:alpha-amylase
VRGSVEVRAVATPDHPTYVVTLYRSVDGGARTAIGTDDSSPVYTAYDDTTGLANGAVVRYKAVLEYAPGRTVESAARSVTVVSEPVPTAIVHYRRPAGDYGTPPNGWGLHLWGDAIADGGATDCAAPRQRTGEDAFGAV